MNRSPRETQVSDSSEPQGARSATGDGRDLHQDTGVSFTARDLGGPAHVESSVKVCRLVA